MMSRSQDVRRLQSYVRDLRYAVATTTCRETAFAFEKMLKEAEASLNQQEYRLNARESKLL